MSRIQQKGERVTLKYDVTRVKKKKVISESVAYRVNSVSCAMFSLPLF